MRMSQNNRQYARYFFTSAIAAVIAATTPTSNASATWIPDLVFPETSPQKKMEPDRAVTGSIPLGKRVPHARHSERNAASGETRK